MFNMINRMFGTNFKFNRKEAPKSLPIYLNINRNFYSLVEKDTEIVIVEILTDEKYGIIGYEKQLNMYNDYYQLPVAFWFKKITKKQRDALISRKISFVTNDGHLYLPYLGIIFTNQFYSGKKVNLEKMMPITQCLFLYMLLKSYNKKIIKKDAAKALNVTNTSLTRASEQLQLMGLIHQEKQGKEHFIWIDENRYDLFQKAKPHLINPIQEIVFVKVDRDFLKFPLSGESALSKMSMLNAPKIQTVAQYKKTRRNLELLDEKWDEGENMIKIEYWKYDPQLLSINNTVDPISLYMSFEGNVDERIESELNDIMEDYAW